MPADKTRMEHSGKRSIRRIRRDQPLRFRTATERARSVTGRMEDLSLHGLRFASPRALRAGEIVCIESDICNAVARVVAADPQPVPGQRRWLIRTEFLTLDFGNPLGSFVSETA